MPWPRKYHHARALVGFCKGISASAFQRELWQLPLGKDTIQSTAKPYADVRVKHIVDFALEAERKCGHRQLVVNTITKNYMIALDALPNFSGVLDDDQFRAIAAHLLYLPQPSIKSEVVGL